MLSEHWTACGLSFFCVVKTISRIGNGLFAICYKLCHIF